MSNTLRDLINELKNQTNISVTIGNESFNIDGSKLDSYSHDGTTFIKITTSGKTRYINQSKIKYFEIL